MGGGVHSYSSTVYQSSKFRLKITMLREGGEKKEGATFQGMGSL